MKLLSTIIVFSNIFLAHAFAQYKYVIYTDESPATKANEVKSLMERLAPFSEMNMQIEVRSLSTADLGCAPDRGIQRLVVCNNRSITRLAMREGFDQPLVVSSNPNYGGSGGGVPVITSAPNVPASMMVHEYMHTLGFCDEYIYSVADLARHNYCSRRLTANRPNLARITPRRGGYSDDQDARRRHRNAIPWFGHIENATPISSGSLGTPAGEANRIGLFPSETCMNSQGTLHIWKPGTAQTIMDSLHAPIGHLEPILREALLSAGLRARDPSTVGPLPIASPLRVSSGEVCDVELPSSLGREANKNLSDLVHVSDTIEKTDLPESTKGADDPSLMKRIDSPNPYQKIEDAYKAIESFGY